MTPSATLLWPQRLTHYVAELIRRMPRTSFSSHYYKSDLIGRQMHGRKSPFYGKPGHIVRGKITDVHYDGTFVLVYLNENHTRPAFMFCDEFVHFTYSDSTLTLFAESNGVYEIYNIVAPRQ